MRFKYLFLFAIFIVLASSIAIVSAEDAEIGDYTFTIPEDFNITNQSDQGIFLEDDVGFYTITLSLAEVKMSEDQALKNLEAQGWDLEKEENTKEIGIFNVTQYVYNYKNAYCGFFFLCENDDDILMITHGTSGQDDLLLDSARDSDVEDLIESFKEKWGYRLQNFNAHVLR